MNEPTSEIDKQLRDTPRVSLVIAIEMNKGKRNVCLFLGILSLAVILFFGWSNWLLLLPAALGIGSFLFHMNSLIVSSELKRRSKEPEVTETPRRLTPEETEEREGMTDERTYLRDSEWASIEGKLCLATAFVPMSGSIVNGAVVAHDLTTPYASVRLKLADYDGDIIGYITNKLDFAMLWAAFNDNALALDGVHREPSLPIFSNLSELPHEIWLVWTRKRYSGPANFLPKAALPKLIVMVAHEDTFDEFAQMPQYAALEPIVAWIPEIKLQSRELALVRHAPGNLKLLSKVWDDVITPT